MSKARSCRRLVLFLRRRQLNTTSFERGAKFRGTERGSEVEVHATHHHQRVSVTSQVRWVVRFPRSRVVVVTLVRGVGGPVVRTDNVTPSQSLRRGGNSTKESGTPGTESQRQDLRKSSRPGLSSVAGTSEGFWKSSRTGLCHPAIQDKWSLLVQPRNPPDAVGNAEVARSRFSR